MLDDDRWLTYSEAGQLLGISAEAARVRARRYKWPRRTPNERGAVARVLVPPDVQRTDRSRPPQTPGRPADVRRTGEGRPPGQTATDTENTSRAIVEIVEKLLTPIREQLDRERARADRAEAALTAAQERIAALLTDRTNPPAPVPATRWSRLLRWQRRP